MPLDYKLALNDSLLTRFRANTNITSRFAVGNIHDEKTDGPARQRLAARAPADLNSLDVEIISGEEQATRTPHFGLTGTVVVCDTIVPVVVTVRIRMRFRSQKLADQTVAESYVRQELHVGYPKLGLAYVRDFTIREQRKPPNENQGVAETTLTLTVGMRLHLSQLRD